MQREVVAVVGNTGCGKSEWTKRYIADANRLLVYDPLASFGGVDWLDNAALCDLADTAPGDFRAGCYRPEIAGTLTDVALILGRCTLVVEEITTLVARGERLPPALRDAVFLGRHPAVSLVVVAQRAGSIPVDMRSQISRLVSFRQTEGDDLSALRYWFPGAVADIPDLAPGECFDSDRGAVSCYKIFSQPP